MKKKILFVISQLYKGGAEVSLVNLLRKIDKDRYKIDLIILDQCPVPGTVNLIPMLPESINVIDIYKLEQQLSIAMKIRKRLLFSKDDLKQYPATALIYAREHEYDWAFHVGEWSLPGFVAKKVHATHKAVWIHTDISKAGYFNSADFFRYDCFFEKYIFVSKNSLDTSIKKFPFLKEKATYIYNINDVSGIKRNASIAINDQLPTKHGMTVLTCANIRQEKNHLRQVKAMKILKDRGIDFTWINIGSTANSACTSELRTAINEYGLVDRFHLLGPKENPYQYMEQADIVAVLSDFESWSMVITEAKILNKPVIATRTSGALEQIENYKTGVLTNFNEVDIANELEKMLTSPILLNSIRDNIRNFDNTEQILNDFYKLVDTGTSKALGAKILYVIDDLNYHGGAHVATKTLIQQLVHHGQNITIFSSVLPTIQERNDMPGVQIIGWEQCLENTLFYRRLIDCLTDPFLPKALKKFKLKMSWEGKIKKNPATFDKFVKANLTRLFSDFDIVCVVSEGSGFRQEVARSTAKRKIQYIHTDYADWCKLNEWTQNISSQDASIYAHFDKIVLLSESIQKKFCALYPELAEKTVVNQNLMPVEKILRQSIRPKTRGTLVKFVTVGRMDYYKGYDRLYRVLDRLYTEGFQFKWTIIGGGENYEIMKAMFASCQFSDCVKLIGQTSNPFVYVKEADVFALFSRYEGLPNTIFEALILGVPVIATNVGGISSQVEEGKNGWLVENEEKAIYDGLVHVLTNWEEIIAYKENLKGYVYDNSKVVDQTERLLGIVEEYSHDN